MIWRLGQFRLDVVWLSGVLFVDILANMPQLSYGGVQISIAVAICYASLTLYKMGNAIGKTAIRIAHWGRSVTV